MFKKWQNIFTAECLVVKFSETEAIYPIFKNGYGSLEKYTKKNKLKVFKNKDISALTKINIFLRDPVDRFVSGVHTDIEFTKPKNLDQYLHNIENLKHYNRHFIPQCYWLLHLFKYYKNEVTLLPFETILDWLPNRGGPPIKKMSKQRREKILSINFEKYVEADQRLLHRYLNKTVQLEKIIREFKNVLSAS